MSFVQNLQWLDADDPEAGKKARAHRQKEFHRARRWKQTQQFREERETARRFLGITPNTTNGAMAGDAPVPKGKGGRGGGKEEVKAPLHVKQFDPKTLKREKERERVTESGIVVTTPGDYSKAKQKEDKASKTNKVEKIYKAEKIHPGSLGWDEKAVGMVLARKQHMDTQPRDFLSSFRRDSLAAMPVALSERENLLVTYYLCDYSRIVYNVSESMIHRDVWFPLAKQGPIAFHAMALYETSRLIARCQGKVDTGETVQLKTKTIRLIQSHLESPLISVRTSDEIMAAVLSMAHSENHFGSKETAAAHLRAVLAMVRQRGGPHVIDRYPQLGMFTNWVNYLTRSAYSLADLVSYSFVPPHLYTPHGFYDDLSDLVSFLHSVEHAAQNYYRTSKRHQIRRRTLFNSYAPSYAICCIPKGYSAWETNLIPVYTRLSALFHIHAALCEYRDKPASMDRYLNELEYAGGQCAYNTSCSIGVYVHYLLKIDYDECARRASDDAQVSPTSAKLLLTSILNETPAENRSWYIARILRVAKLLGKEGLQKLHAKLMSYLDPSNIMAMDGRISEEPSESEDGDPVDPWIENIRLEIRTRGGSGDVSTPNSSGTGVSTPGGSMRSSPDMWPR